MSRTLARVFAGWRTGQPGPVIVLQAGTAVNYFGTGLILPFEIIYLHQARTSVQTPTGGFHIAGTDVATGRIDWNDGSYSLLGSTDHSAFNTTAGTADYTEAHTDFADNYSADGVLELRGKFYSVEHVTVTDGVIVRVAFDHTHIRGTFC